MNELMNSSGEITISSRDIAEITGKQHHHVMRDIRNREPAYIQVYGGESKFGLANYFDDQDKARPEYRLNKSQAIFIMQNYDLVLQAKIQKRMEQLERERIQQPAKIPTLEESLEMSLKLVRENKALQELNEQQDSIIMEMDDAMDKKDSALIEMNEELSEYHHLFKGKKLMDTGTVADLLGYKGKGRTNFRKMLLDDGVFMRNSERKIIPKRDQIELGRFKLDPVYVPNLDSMVNQIKVTEKGFVFLVKHCSTKGLEKIHS